MINELIRWLCLIPAPIIIMGKIFLDSETGDEYESEALHGGFYLLEPKPKKAKYRICMWLEDNPESEVFEFFINLTKPETKSVTKAVQAIVDYTEDGELPAKEIVDPYVMLAQKIITAKDVPAYY